MDYTAVAGYIVMTLFCVLILALLLDYGIKVLGLQHENRVYIRMNVYNIVVFLLDIAFIVMDGKIVHTNQLLFFVILLIYFTATGLAGLYWMWYMTEDMRMDFFHDRTHRILSYIPLWIFVGLSAVSYWTHWVYYVDESATYHRGPLFLLQYIVPFGYVAVASVVALVQAVHKKNSPQRNKMFLYAALTVPMVISAAARLFVREVPVVWLAITFILLLLYMRQQYEMVSVDPLTRINNRFQIMQYLMNKLMAYDEKTGLYLFMMDLDDFKSINDNYGHVEGDAALVRAADCLKRVCYGQNYFIGRFGGDEFILVAEISDDEAAERVCKSIKREIAAANVEANTKYTITISIGYARYAKFYKDIVSFIAAADENLYKAKKEKQRNV